MSLYWYLWFQTLVEIVEISSEDYWGFFPQKKHLRSKGQHLILWCRRNIWDYKDLLWFFSQLLVCCDEKSCREFYVVKGIKWSYSYLLCYWASDSERMSNWRWEAHLLEHVVVTVFACSRSAGCWVRLWSGSLTPLHSGFQHLAYIVKCLGIYVTCPQ